MNIFEGARRIVHCCAGLGVFFYVALWWSSVTAASEFFRYSPYLVASLLGWYAFAWGLGWIVRGFMGIPLGKDERDH